MHCSASGPVGFNPGDEDWLAPGQLLMDGSLRINTILPAVLPDADLRAIRAPTLLLIAEHEIHCHVPPASRVIG
jgi:hypothetical protein